MEDKIKAILTQRNAPIQTEQADCEFFSLHRGESAQEAFVEFRFREGVHCAFPYQSVTWINLDLVGGVLDIDFTGITVSIFGRGLRPVFDHIKARKICWLQPADAAMQDDEKNETFISDIQITPNGAGSEEEET